MLQTVILLWQKYGYVYLFGLWGTIWLAAVTVAAASVLGALIALMKLSQQKVLDAFTTVYISLIRGTPILLQLYFFWLVLPKLLPVRIGDTACIVIALIVNASAYIAEVIRAGIQAVDQGQAEAARSLGLSAYHTMKQIILPQAIKNILPALGNEYISMVKQTSLASVFFIQELTTSYKTVQAATFLAIPSLLIAGVIYFLLTSMLARGLQFYERSLRCDEG
ncbi:MAG: amino acid ABC transporter permease [Negativicutes bacterium]|nr:amino acid ABC transporter permease [Negativicutes bacterium]